MSIIDKVVTAVALPETAFIVNVSAVIGGRLRDEHS